MPPRFVAPGELISYSNHVYALAAYVVEAVSGLPFDRYVRDQILLPLVSTTLGLGVLILSAVLWRRKTGSPFARLYYTSVALCAVLFAWFLSYWNLLGFHLG
jgi:hypothetical protein